VSKLGVGMILGYPRSDTVLWFKGHRVTGSVSAFFTLLTITPMLTHI